MQNLKLICMDSVQSEQVKWLWHPYIPLGKITIIQGDPGEGKTTFALALVAALTRGEPIPEIEQVLPPINVIYQTAEDGLGDTIKPRLELLGADCSRVLVIDESDKELTMRDKRLEQAITKTGAKLLVLDPIQAYLGGNVDMHRANEVRPVIKQIGLMAERTGCAVVMIGHINKAHGQKSSYRGLGSIDFRAAARSILVVGRSKEDSSIRIAAHDKSSLVPEGRSIVFELSDERGFIWRGYCDATVDDVLSGSCGVQTKTAQMESALREMLRGGPVASDEIVNRAKEMGVSERTVKIAKQNLGVKSVKIGDKWFTDLPRGQGGNVLRRLHPCLLPGKPSVCRPNFAACGTLGTEVEEVYQTLSTSRIEAFVGDSSGGKSGSKRKQVKGGWSHGASPPKTPPRNAGRGAIPGYT